MVNVLESQSTHPVATAIHNFVGKIVKVDDFDDNRFNECSTGIHFFIAREMAVKY